MGELAQLLQWELIARVLVAFALGAVIGFERERRAKVAGLRTHMLVAGGAGLFTVASYALFAGEGPGSDPSRVAAQIVSGIGFLGAGAIIHAGGSVAGLTTAASIWIVAAIGMVAGGGGYPLALVSTLVTVIVLRLPRERLRPHVRPRPRPSRAAPPQGNGAAPALVRYDDAVARGPLGLRRGRRLARRRARPPGR